MQDSRPHVLCVDDDRETAGIIADELADRGFSVSTAFDGGAGLAAKWSTEIQLTGREAETLHGPRGDMDRPGTWAARGKTSFEIGAILGLTKRTVDFHIDNARQKLNAWSRLHAA